MRDTGKVKNIYQLPRSRIFTNNQLPGISFSLVVLPSNEVFQVLEQQFSGVITGKDDSHGKR
jgi:hypothetical protein